MNYTDNQIMTIKDLYELYALNVNPVVSKSICLNWYFENSDRMFVKAHNDKSQYIYHASITGSDGRESAFNYTTKLRDGWSILNDETNKLVRYKDLKLSMVMKWIITIKNDGIYVGWQMYNYSQTFTKRYKDQINIFLGLVDNTTGTKYYNKLPYSYNIDNLYDASGNIITKKNSTKCSSSWFSEFQQVNTSHALTPFAIYGLTSQTGQPGNYVAQEFIEILPIVEIINERKDYTSYQGSQTGSGGSDFRDDETYYLPDGTETESFQDFINAWNEEYNDSQY